MNSEDMTVTEFVMLLWKNKVKVTVLILVVAFAPGFYQDWATKKAAQELARDRDAVDTQASLAGMMVLSAWKKCALIGISDINTRSQYEGRLLQEQSAPVLAKIAVEQRDSYLKGCQRFYDFEYCRKLLERSIQLSNLQSRE